MKKQNVVLKVGIGVMLGIGALTFAPQAAHASTPCDPQSPCTPPPNTIMTFDQPSTIPDECLSTNCDNTNWILFGCVSHVITYTYTGPPGFPPRNQYCYTTVYSPKHPCQP